LDWDNEKNEGIFLVKKNYFLHFWVLFGGDVPKSYLSSHKNSWVTSVAAWRWRHM